MKAVTAWEHWLGILSGPVYERKIANWRGFREGFMELQADFSAVPTAWRRTQSGANQSLSSKFPGSREKYREFCAFETFNSVGGGDKPLASLKLSSLLPFSRHNLAGNFLLVSGNRISGLRILRVEKVTQKRLTILRCGDFVNLNRRRMKEDLCRPRAMSIPHRLKPIFMSIGGLQAHVNSVLSQELVLKLDRGLPYATLFRKTAALEAHDNPIIAVSAGNIAVADVRMSESEVYLLLSTIPKEPAELSETVHGAGTEAELLSARLASYLDMEVIKAVVAIEAQPDKSHLGRGVLDTNSSTVPHDEEYIPDVLFGSWRKIPITHLLQGRFRPAFQY